MFKSTQKTLSEAEIIKKYIYTVTNELSGFRSELLVEVEKRTAIAGEKIEFVKFGQQDDVSLEFNKFSPPRINLRTRKTTLSFLINDVVVLENSSSGHVVSLCTQNQKKKKRLVADIIIIYRKKPCHAKVVNFSA